MLIGIASYHHRWWRWTGVIISLSRTSRPLMQQFLCMTLSAWFWASTMFTCDDCVIYRYLYECLCPTITSRMGVPAGWSSVWFRQRDTKLVGISETLMHQLTMKHYNFGLKPFNLWRSPPLFVTMKPQVCSLSVNVTPLCLFSVFKVSVQSLDVQVNGNSGVGVCVNHLSEGVHICVCLCACILVNSLFAGVCEEWIISYNRKSPRDRHSNITQSHRERTAWAHAGWFDTP